MKEEFYMYFSDIKKNVDKFFIKNGMHYSTINFDEESEKFKDEMTMGLMGDSSLKMIPSYIEPNIDFALNENVIIIDAGGTNLRCALVSINDQRGIIIKEYNKYPMPGSKELIHEKDFFKILGSYIKPLLAKSKKIGFCFSYPVEIMPDNDGKVIELTKEIQVIDIENKFLGVELKKYLKSEGINESIEITVMNDSVASLLSGLSCKGNFNSYIGLIVGTGINSSYMETNQSIYNCAALKDGNMVINIESGGYDKLSMGKIDMLLENRTLDSNKQIMEKMISGAYLGTLVLETLKAASVEGELSQDLSKKILDLIELSTKDVSQFLNDCWGNNNQLGIIINKFGKEDDRIKIYYICDLLVERAAVITAISVKGILLKSGEGKNPCRPVCVIVDGTTFYNLYSFKEKFNYYIKKHLADKGYYIKCVKVEDDILVGTAIGALLNHK